MSNEQTHEARREEREKEAVKAMAKDLAQKRELRLEDISKPPRSQRCFGSDFFIGASSEYYAIGIYAAGEDNTPQPYLLTAEGQTLSFEEIRQERIIISNLPPCGSPYDPSGLEYAKWVRADCPEIKTLDVFQKARTFISQHYYLGDEAEAKADVLALFALSTHVWRAFGSAPSLLIQADPESGKSRLCQVLANLVFRPQTTGDPSKAALFRLADATGGTFLLDNFDGLADEQKEGLIQLIECGYQDGIGVLRVEDGISGRARLRVPTVFRVAGPRIVATTQPEDLSDAFKTRAILLVSEKKPANVNMPDIPPERPSDEGSVIQQELYIWGLTHAESYREKWASFDPKLSNRERQIGGPLVFIANEVGGNIAERIRNYLAQVFESARVSDDDETADILSYLGDRINGQSSREILISAKDVAATLLSAQGIDEHISGEDGNDRLNPAFGKAIRVVGKRAAKAMEKIPGSRKVNHGGRAVFHLRIEALRRYLARKGIVGMQDTLPTDSHDSLNSLDQPRLTETNTITSVGGESKVVNVSEVSQVSHVGLVSQGEADGGAQP